MKNRVLENPIVFTIIILFLLQGCSSKKTITGDILSNEIELSEIIKNSILGINCNYDGSHKEIFLGDYSQINNNEK